MIKVVHDDLRVLKYCNRGAREFFINHELNWQLFTQEGIDITILEQIDDVMSKRVCKEARRRVSEGN